jgi:hypothetical protein
MAYLNDPRTPSKTTNIDAVAGKAKESLPQVFDVYKRTQSFFTGVIMSESTKLNIVFSFKKLGLRRYEFKLITIEVKSGFQPRKRDDYLVKVSGKTKTLKGQRAIEIGPDIYALPTSFEGADPYGLIVSRLVGEIMARRSEFAPGFCGSFDSADGAIYCVASVDRGGSFLVDSAFWQPYGDFQTVRVK